MSQSMFGQNTVVLAMALHLQMPHVPYEGIGGTLVVRTLE